LENGEIIGIAVAVEGWSGYYPIGHREGNLDKRIVLEWFKEVCATDCSKNISQCHVRRLLD
jgi:hypothetical protein